MSTSETYNALSNRFIVGEFKMRSCLLRTTPIVSPSTGGYLSAAILKLIPLIHLQNSGKIRFHTFTSAKSVPENNMAQVLIFK